jgi:hypothetical protein
MNLAVRFTMLGITNLRPKILSQINAPIIVTAGNFTDSSSIVDHPILAKTDGDVLCIPCAAKRDRRTTAIHRNPMRSSKQI